MQQRKYGRPSGTDGSDFSYRMVVDSRYTKVAKGKSRLHALILTQVVIQLVGLLSLAMSISKEKVPDSLAIAATAIGFFSLLIGEVGLRRSKAGLLRMYMAASSIGLLISLFDKFSSGSALEVMLNPSEWEAKKFEVIENSLLLSGLLVQIFAVVTTISLIGNMSPPKKSS
ncbi:unnamed protein product [Linum tenue]|uniref:Uncharacterized protein n=1 Tax=Linum tenue TaxID=586396 RepID=A0AAV0QT55_9ROSI|nr:unnamed protein product [Linum tenue]